MVLSLFQEDEQLRKLVMINGAQKWSVVAEKIKVRHGRHFAKADHQHQLLDCTLTCSVLAVRPCRVAQGKVVV